MYMQRPIEKFIFVAVPDHLLQKVNEEEWRKVKDIIRSCIDEQPVNPANVLILHNVIASCHILKSAWARPVYDRIQKKTWDGSNIQAWLYDQTPNGMVLLDGPRDPWTKRVTRTVEDIIAPYRQESHSRYQRHDSRALGCQGLSMCMPFLSSCAVTTTSPVSGSQSSTHSMQLNIYQRTTGDHFTNNCGWCTERCISESPALSLAMHSHAVHTSRSSSVSTASSGIATPSETSSATSHQSDSMSHFDGHHECQRSDSSTGSTSVSEHSQGFRRMPAPIPSQTPVKVIKGRVKCEKAIELNQVPFRKDLKDLRSALENLLRLRACDFHMLPRTTGHGEMTVTINFKSSALLKQAVESLKSSKVRLRGLLVEVESIKTSCATASSEVIPTAMLVPDTVSGNPKGPVIIDGSLTD